MMDQGVPLYLVKGQIMGFVAMRIYLEKEAGRETREKRNTPWSSRVQNGKTRRNQIRKKPDWNFL